MPSDSRVAYFYDENISVYASVEASLLKPHILKLTHELIKAYELDQHMRMCACGTQWSPATPAAISKFHTDAYVHFLQQLTCNAWSVADETTNHLLNHSVCFAENTWLYSTAYAGGAMAAAQSLWSGESDIAICLMGGQTHARRDCASGFSYVNDVVLVILHLLRPDPHIPTEPERRVLYVNVDGWHCSGVEEAFYTTDRVLSISLHRYAEGSFPGSGGMADIGGGKGKHYNINLPVADGLDDEGFTSLLQPVVAAAAARFCPHCVVVCAGAGVVSGDRLGCLNVSVDAHAAFLKELMSLDLPLLVLGGGGYSQLNAARVWCNATATLCGVELPERLPSVASLDCYPEELALAVPPATMQDMNTAASLELVRDVALKTLEEITQRTKPLPRAKRSASADAVAKEGPTGEAPVAAPDSVMSDGVAATGSAASAGGSDALVNESTADGTVGERGGAAGEPSTSTANPITSQVTPSADQPAAMDVSACEGTTSDEPGLVKVDTGDMDIDEDVGGEAAGEDPSAGDEVQGETAVGESGAAPDDA